MELTPLDTTPKKAEKPFIPWEGTERVRPPWQLQKHGKVVAAPNDQKSNQKLTDEQVLQPRTEPIISGSQATPLDGRHGTASGPSDEPSGRKQTGNQGIGISL